MTKSTALQEASAAREQLREQIRQTVRDAQIAAEEATKEAAKSRGQNEVIVVPGAPRGPMVTVTGVPSLPPGTIPPEAAQISIAFFVVIGAIIIGLPIMRALGRRIERGAPVAAPIPVEVRNQLLQISQSVDAIAIEVERISEGQRYATKLLSDRPREGTVVTPNSSLKG